jgi:pimeloyl-ACP methyl ester carboxylesterase
MPPADRTPPKFQVRASLPASIRLLPPSMSSHCVAAAARVNPRPTPRWIKVALAIWLTTAVPGCAILSPTARWNPPGIPGHLPAGEDVCSRAFASARAADEQNSADAPRLWLVATQLAWRELPPGAPHSISNIESCAAWQRYQLALGRFLETARDQGLWKPGQGFQVSTARGPIWIPIVSRGFSWQTGEFQQLRAVGCYSSPSLTRHHVRDGVGAPVVVERGPHPPLRPGDEFLGPHALFAATAVLRPVTDAAGESSLVLELWNPRHTAQVEGPRGAVPLAADLSAPFVYHEAEVADLPDPFEMFVHPDNAPEFEGLLFLEPYQPGKIPVILVHGLLSSPRTWIDLANDLRANPEFTARYQLWAFGYATGRPFVRAAADLRRQLRLALEELQATGPDPALDQVVLIGHSMGGLISKLQVTHSGDALWTTVSDLPLDALEIPEDLRDTVEDMMYFEPTPAVKRVIFVGTPHRGAALAHQFIGRVSSSLVKRDPDGMSRLVQLAEQNEGFLNRLIWKPFFGQPRLPTSIDLLDPQHPLLQAVDSLPIDQRVQVHTIAGKWLYTIGPGGGDGVVPLSSAVHPLAQTELVINASHTAVHRAPESIAEIWNILKLHADGVPRLASEPIEAAPAVPQDTMEDVPPEPVLSTFEQR